MPVGGWSSRCDKYGVLGCAGFVYGLYGWSGARRGMVCFGKRDCGGVWAIKRRSWWSKRDFVSWGEA